jgi:hypothetical protein
MEAAGNLFPTRTVEAFPAPLALVSFFMTAPRRLIVPSDAALLTAVAIPIFQRDCALLI